MKNKKKSIKGKILGITIFLLVISNISIGVLSFNISSKQLDEKGEVILKNSVEFAIQMIDLAEKEVQRGSLSREEAQERVKTYLLGEKQEDGTRPNQSPLNLGKSGYFVVYSQDGDEVAHPTLEGENVWTVEDKAGNGNLLVQESIKKANAGGGFTYYDWFLPNSEEIGTKIVYNKLIPTGVGLLLLEVTKVTLMQGPQMS